MTDAERAAALAELQDLARLQERMEKEWVDINIECMEFGLLVEALRARTGGGNDGRNL